jgi:hypothetical protein
MRPLLTGYLVTGAASLGLLAVAWRWPRRGRWPFAVLFAGAALFNAVTALRTPEVYVAGLGPRAFPPMRQVIEDAVALAPGPFVLAIAAGQLLVAAGLARGRGAPFRVAVVGGATFLAAISWLGTGAAFPTNLVLAGGVVLLLRGERRP